MPFDKALNIRRHISSDITTDIPIKAKYQDGIKFTISVRSPVIKPTTVPQRQFLPPELTYSTTSSPTSQM